MSAERQLNPSEFTDEQLDRIAFAIAGRVLKLVQVNRFLTSDEAAEFTRYSRRTFDRLVANGVFTAHAAEEGSDPRFLAEELISQMPERKRKSALQKIKNS